MFDLIGIALGILVVVFFISIVYFFTRKGYVLKGLIPILVISLCTIIFGTICQNKVSQYTIETKIYPVGENTAKILIKSDNSGNTVTFSHIYLTNNSGQLLDIISINGAVHSKPYHKLIDKITTSNNFDGVSEDINIVTNHVAYFENAEVSPMEVYIFGGIFTIMLCCIYALQWKIFRENKLRKELKKLKLDSL